MKLLIVNKVLTKAINFLETIGKILNQNPTQEEAEKVPGQSHASPPFLKNKNNSNPKPQKQKPPKNVYVHKGSGYKGKGNINTDAATFNHPRNDVSHGRRH